MIVGYLLLNSLVAAVRASSVADLVGTWTTKSRSVVTGPVRSIFPSGLHQSLTSRCILQDFYDPIDDKLLEPSLTGISYSFTADGYYEQAYYRAVSNRQCSPLFLVGGCFLT
jgi:hypothetical protein